MCCRLLVCPLIFALVSRGLALPIYRVWSAVSILCSDVLSAGLFISYVLVAWSCFSLAAASTLSTVVPGTLTV